MVDNEGNEGEGGSGLGKLDGSEEPAPLGAAEPLMVTGTRTKKSGPSAASRVAGAAKKKRSWVWVVVALVAIIALALAPPFIKGWKKTPKNRIGISYGGGPFEAAHYQKIVQPGSSLFFNGFYDPLYLYPSDQQNYIISLQKGVGAQKSPDSIIAPTADRVQVTYQLAVYFKLNTALLRQFHEQLGLRYNAYTSSGWYNLIRDTFRQQIESALQEETRKVNVADIFGNAQSLVSLQNKVQESISAKLQAALGAKFFCSPNYHVGGPCGDPIFLIKAVTVPSSVTKAFQDNRTSAIAVLTKENEIKQREAEAQSIKALGMTGDQYAMLKAIESGQIKFWVLPSNGGVTLTGPNASGSSGSAGK